MSKQYEGCFRQRLGILTSKYALLYLFPYGFGIHSRNLSSSHRFLAGSYYPHWGGVTITYVRNLCSGLDQEWLPGTSLQSSCGSPFLVTNHLKIANWWGLKWSSSRITQGSEINSICFNSILKCAQSQEVRRQEAGRDWFGSSTAKEPLQAACPKTSLSSGLTASAELAKVFPETFGPFGFSDLFALLWADVLWPFQKFRVEVLNRFMFTESFQVTRTGAVVGGPNPTLGLVGNDNIWQPRHWMSICQAMAGWIRGRCQLVQVGSGHGSILEFEHLPFNQFKPI